MIQTANRPHRQIRLQVAWCEEPSPVPALTGKTGAARFTHHDGPWTCRDKPHQELAGLLQDDAALAAAIGFSPAGSGPSIAKNLRQGLCPCTPGPIAGFDRFGWIAQGYKGKGLKG